MSKFTIFLQLFLYCCDVFCNYLFYATQTMFSLGGGEGKNAHIYIFILSKFATAETFTTKAGWQTIWIYFIIIITIILVNLLNLKFQFNTNMYYRIAMQNVSKIDKIPKDCISQQIKQNNSCQPSQLQK